MNESLLRVFTNNSSDTVDDAGDGIGLSGDASEVHGESIGERDSSFIRGHEALGCCDDVVSEIGVGTDSIGIMGYDRIVNIVSNVVACCPG